MRLGLVGFEPASLLILMVRIRLAPRRQALGALQSHLSAISVIVTLCCLYRGQKNIDFYRWVYQMIRCQKIDLLLYVNLPEYTYYKISFPLSTFVIS